MKLRLSTTVSNHYLAVKERFNADLFVSLNPPFPPVKLKRFDGCENGDKVQLQLNFLLFKQDWHSLITESKTDETEFLFVDEGTQLPFMFSYWRHRHIIRRVDETTTEIIDDIEYKAHVKVLDLLLWPALLLQFAYRKPIYKRQLQAGK